MPGWWRTTFGRRRGWPLGTPPTVPGQGPVQFHCPACQTPVERRERTCPACGADLLPERRWWRGGGTAR